MQEDIFQEKHVTEGCSSDVHGAVLLKVDELNLWVWFQRAPYSANKNVNFEC